MNDFDLFLWNPKRIKDKQSTSTKARRYESSKEEGLIEYRALFRVFVVKDCDLVFGFCHYSIVPTLECSIIPSCYLLRVMIIVPS